MHTGVFTDIPFDQDGQHHGFISIPFSVDRSPYYQIKIPVYRLKNGDGPRLLLMAGNHGDEYEGEICLSKLTRLLKPQDIQGEVTLIPFLNLPAVMAARRGSPLDHENLNRCFPGDPSGTPSRRLAYYLEHDLFGRHDVVFDIHSGGTTMAHLPLVLAEEQEKQERMQAVESLLSCMDVRYALIARNGAQAPTSMAAAARAGILGISGEFGGGGAVTPHTLATLEHALNQLMLKLGITRERIFPHSAENSPYTGSMSFLSLTSHEQAIYATRRGWFEPAAEVGDEVREGQTAGWLHDFQDCTAPQKELKFKVSGVVISRRLSVDSEAGDCLIQVGVLAAAH
ncbi:MAG: deacylase [Castellaniella sp.]|uniref:succinylglutamate desuccinylase/aspartoacylase domain-containing protein n=1 Tax=Castellaniella sp. TaxID=1955812 RepID=UPI0011F73C81|nr:succinylglutamate desuccinylase/aspartoacylase family protein [Castellaniella sp.]TAN25825.1 MAG: deacylase [Castellaniella sp.]